MTTSMIRRLTLSTAAAVALASLLTGCSVIDSLVPDRETRDSDTGEIVEGGDTDVFALQEGDCLGGGESTDAAADSSSTEVSNVPTVPCDEPHSWEVFKNVTMTDDSYPGEQAAGDTADEECVTAFADFAGIGYDESVYYTNYYFPTAESWATGDRTINCLIGSEDEMITGSLRGIAQ
jgi:hypothetical protein